MARNASRAGAENVRVLRHDGNRGLGAALRTAFADGRTPSWPSCLDADLSYSPAIAMELIEALERRTTPTSRSLRRTCSADRWSTFRCCAACLSREANRLLSLATSGRYATLTCMVRAYRTVALQRAGVSQRRDGRPSPRCCSYALRQKLRVVEVPATLRVEQGARSAGAADSTSPGPHGRSARTVLLAFRHRPALWLAVPDCSPDSCRWSSPCC